MALPKIKKDKKKMRPPTDRRSLSGRFGLNRLKSVSFSRPQLAIFIVAFGLIGYFLYHSFAASPIVANLQAEQMTLPTGSSVITDSSASSGQAVKLSANGTASGSVSFPSAVSSLTVVARGDQCQGAPTMTVTLDGSSLMTNTAVSSTGWAAYSAVPSASVLSGTHNFSISFNNAYNNPGHGRKGNGSCTRSLYADVTNFYGPVAPPPLPPTVALSASPTSLAAGQTSTLTWSSTNATACTAAGAWSGAQPTSGSTSTGALNQSSTYTLTCTGSGGSATASVTVSVNTTGSCTVSPTLVNSCRPLFGAAVGLYPQVASDTQSQILYHEQRIGHQLDLPHTYHPVGSNQLSSADKYFATRSNSTYLFTNWKPAANWADAGGGNATVNTGIDQMAASIKSVAPHKIMLTIFHEPENDVSSGATGCTTYKGTAGTPADYRAMWQNVRNRFDAAGVNNVVWVMDYMNYAPWDCMVDDLWPGNNLVDWVMFNAYAEGSSPNFASKVNHFQNLLTSLNDTNHDFLSKPWGIVEWSVSASLYSTTQAVDYYNQINNSIKQKTFPRLKSYMVYDNRDFNSSTGADFRVAYDPSGTYNAARQQAYNSIINSILAL